MTPPAPNEAKNLTLAFEQGIRIDIGKKEQPVYSQYVFGNKIQIIDLAIFPFIRQFANVDFDLFNTNFANIIKWYEKIVNSKRFTSIMKKYEFWSNDNQPLINNLYKQH